MRSKPETKPGRTRGLCIPEENRQKYFDFWDYSTAKAKMKNKQLPPTAPDKTEVTGDHIPTPEALPQGKPSISCC
uniref:Uncharacterized protein n=2 Tax=Sus scrofa TaxID=9823 RepID=A0A8D0K7B4_PIG